MWVAVTGPRSKVTLTGPSPSFPFSVLCPHVWVLAWSCGHSSAPPPTSPVKGRPCWTENKNHGFQVHFILYHGIGCLARNMVQNKDRGPWAWKCALGSIVQIWRLRPGRYDLG